MKEEPKKSFDPESEADLCSFDNDTMVSGLPEFVEELMKLFGPQVLNVKAFHERYVIHKCFLEIYLNHEGRFRIFNFQNFEFVMFKNVFIQKLLHRSCTLFVFSLRKAKAIYPESMIHSERKGSPFYEHKTLLKEITPLYVNEKWKDLFKLQFMANRTRFVKLPNILQSVTELNKHNPYNLANEELELELLELIAMEESEMMVLPEKLTDFVYTRVYCIPTKLRPSHMIREGSVAIPTKVNDREVFLRRDLVKLYTKVQWRNKGREVRRGEVPLKELNFNDGAYRVEYFDYPQTCELKFVLNEDGSIPRNDYGNIEIMNGLPPGTRHIGLKGVKFVMKKLDIDWVPAVTEFEFRNGRFYPILSGVVVHDRDYNTVVTEYNKRREELEKREELKETKLMDKLWKDIFKTLYTKKYFKEKQA